MKRFTHGNFTEAFIASVGSMTGIVKDTLELTEICRWYSLKITLISSIFICGYFSFYTFYYLKSITFKNVYLFWHLAKSKLSLWVSLEKKKRLSMETWRKDWNPWTQAVTLTVCVPFLSRLMNVPPPTV